MVQEFLKVCERNINYRNFFTKQKEYITIGELSKLIEIQNLNDLNPADKIYNVRTLKEATQQDISFLSNTKYIKDLENTNAGFCFVQDKIVDKVSPKTKAIIVKNPHYCYTVILNELFFIPMFAINPEISDRAYISKTAKIGKNVEIQAGAYIDDNVVIGNNCKICANAVINHNVIIGNGTYIGANSTISYAEIGNNVIIQSNVAIGQCGFGFAHNNGFNYKIPQLGIVKIGDFVEINSGATIARGAFDDTEIGTITKIDSLCQIGHGVKIGMGCFFAGQAGVAGSTKVGMFCQFGGQSGLAGHINIADFTEVAGQSGVVADTQKGDRLGGYPAQNMMDWHRETILLRKMLKKGK